MLGVDVGMLGTRGLEILVPEFVSCIGAEWAVRGCQWERQFGIVGIEIGRALDTSPASLAAFVQLLVLGCCIGCGFRHSAGFEASGIWPSSGAGIWATVLMVVVLLRVFIGPLLLLGVFLLRCFQPALWSRCFVPFCLGRVLHPGGVWRFG